MKNIILILILLISANNFAQTTPVATTKDKTNDAYILDLQRVEKAFKSDVKRGTLKLYVMGGIVSAIKDVDREFEQLYKIQYHDFGCLVPANLDYYERYNNLVFEYLDQNFGDDWMVTLNPSVLAAKIIP